MTNEELFAFVKKNPISVACGVVAVGLVLSLYFRSGLQEEAEGILAERTAAGERIAANIKNSADLEEDFARISEANKEVALRAVRINELGTNSQFFYKLEGDTGVKLVDFRQTTQSAAKGRGTYQPVGFSVSVQGDLPQLLHFMRLLESGSRYCRVMSASIARSSSAGRNAPMTLSLNLELLGTP